MDGPRRITVDTTSKPWRIRQQGDPTDDSYRGIAHVDEGSFLHLALTDPAAAATRLEKEPDVALIEVVRHTARDGHSSIDMVNLRLTQLGLPEVAAADMKSALRLATAVAVTDEELRLRSNREIILAEALTLLEVLTKGSTTAKEREEAARSLMELGSDQLPPWVPAALRLLTDGGPNTGDSKTIDQATIESMSPSLAVGLVRGGATYGDAGLLVRFLLFTPTEKPRKGAAKGLGQLDAASVAPALAEQLDTVIASADAEAIDQALSRLHQLWASVASPQALQALLELVPELPESGTARSLVASLTGAPLSSADAVIQVGSELSERAMRATVVLAPTDGRALLLGGAVSAQRPWLNDSAVWAPLTTSTLDQFLSLPPLRAFLREPPGYDAIRPLLDEVVATSNRHRFAELLRSGGAVWELFTDDDVADILSSVTTHDTIGRRLKAAVDRIGTATAVAAADTEALDEAAVARKQVQILEEAVERERQRADLAEGTARQAEERLATHLREAREKFTAQKRMEQIDVLRPVAEALQHLARRAADPEVAEALAEVLSTMRSSGLVLLGEAGREAAFDPAIHHLVGSETVEPGESVVLIESPVVLQEGSRVTAIAHGLVRVTNRAGDEQGGSDGS
ncbi:MAG: hypothetical protein JJU45_16510 [Acidimicrobiia bacterium]|nr:hypothetical protein [Acidimicrobiia bacterium]